MRAPLIALALLISCGEPLRVQWHRRYKIEVHTAYWHGIVYEMAPNDNSSIYTVWYQNEEGQRVQLPDECVKVRLQEFQ